MGGLSAILCPAGSSAAPTLLKKMAAAAPHRGPAGEPIVLNGAAVLVQSDTGGAADCAVDGVLAAALTGQLYNAAEVREALRATPFRTTESAGDADLILAAYRCWGEDCVRRFDGDFALVVIDGQHGRLFAARDPFGMRPLHHARLNGSVLLASEPAQLRAAGVAATPSDETIVAYLALDRSLFTGPRTFYCDIDSIEPAHTLTIDRGGPRTARYWRLGPSTSVAERTEDEMVERVRTLLLEAVRRRIPGRAPYGCAISGGFDSSTVAAIYRRELQERGINAPLTSFSFEMRDRDADEPELIELVAREVRAEHTHVYLDQDNVFEVLPKIIRAADQPQFDMGLLYLWRKKEAAAAKQVRVMMSGLGGDEVFLGRYHYLADLLRNARLGGFVREFRAIYPMDRSTGKRTTWQRLLNAYVVSPLLPRAWKFGVRERLLGQDPVRPHIRPDVAKRIGLVDRLRAGPDRVYADAYRQDCWEVFNYLLINLSVPIHEAMGAALGVETRFPLLDRALVEYLFAVPREQKVRAGETRILQRRAMAGLLPEAVTTEHLKKNMNPVLWRQQRPHFVGELDRLMSKPTLLAAEWVAADRLRAMYQRYRSSPGPSDDEFLLWYVLSLERWLEIASGR